MKHGRRSPREVLIFLEAEKFWQSTKDELTQIL